MKPFAFLVLVCLAASASGQQPSATPSKSPFQGFGNTSLDRRKPGGLPTGLPPKPSSLPDSQSQKPFAPVTGSHTGEGIVLSNGWQGRLAQAAGGQAMKIADLRTLLTPFGKAEPDTAPHPDVIIYEGPRMDGAPGETSRITYLMPLREAEAALFKSRGITTSSRAVAPGLPDGLFLHIYDVKAGIYNRLCIVTDGAKPDPQVVSILLKAEGVNYYPPSPFRKVIRDWHTFDYINTENRGQSGIQIDTRVNDLREAKRAIIVITTGGSMPDLLSPPGVVVKPARSSPKETTTWYVPEPLIRMILYCLDNQSGQ